MMCMPSGSQLCSRLHGPVNVATGSASAGRVRDLTAGKLTSKVSDGIADGRGRQYPTRSRR